MPHGPSDTWEVSPTHGERCSLLNCPDPNSTDLRVAPTVASPLKASGPRAGGFQAAAVNARKLKKHPQRPHASAFPWAAVRGHAVSFMLTGLTEPQRKFPARQWVGFPRRSPSLRRTPAVAQQAARVHGVSRGSRPFLLSVGVQPCLLDPESLHRELAGARDPQGCGLLGLTLECVAIRSLSDRWPWGGSEPHRRGVLRTLLGVGVGVGLPQDSLVAPKPSGCSARC